MCSLTSSRSAPQRGEGNPAKALLVLAGSVFSVSLIFAWLLAWLTPATAHGF
jgi:hypothetical protein